MSDMGERADRLARGIIGFHARIISHNAAFKLGQDERDDVLADILNGLSQEEETLAGAIRRYNSHRI
jgi:transcriptional regulator